MDCAVVTTINPRRAPMSADLVIVIAYHSIQYDAIVVNVSCSQAIDTLDCLRSVPFDTLNAAINTTYVLASNCTIAP